MKIRAIAPNEWKYTYSQSMQITGQTGNIGHLRGDFDSGGYGFYTTWNDHRPQWKTDEFKTEMDYVINALRSPEYGLLQNRPAMSEYARRFPNSAFRGNYCTAVYKRKPQRRSIWALAWRSKARPYCLSMPMHRQISQWRWDIPRPTIFRLRDRILCRTS